MPALATYSTDKTALKKAFMIGLILSGIFLICTFLPRNWQLFDIAPNFIGDMISCLYMGKYHIGYAISSAFGLFVTHGSLFGLALSGFLWKNNQKMASYHFVMAVFDLVHAAMDFWCNHRRSRRHVLFLLYPYNRQLYAVF